MIHDLKIWPDYFCEVFNGRKAFEIRKNDRNFQVGDILNLREWNPNTESYTGRSVRRKVIYCLTQAPGLERGYCILGVHWHIGGNEH